jgi:hypothetical protein
MIQVLRTPRRAHASLLFRRGIFASGETRLYKDQWRSRSRSAISLEAKNVSMDTSH